MTQSYDEAKRWLGKKQREIYEALAKLGESTDAELAVHLGMDNRSVGPRRNELMNMGLISHSRNRICKVTNEKVRAWVIQGGEVKPQGQGMESFF